MLCGTESMGWFHEVNKMFAIIFTLILPIIVKIGLVNLFITFISPPFFFFKNFDFLKIAIKMLDKISIKSKGCILQKNAEFEVIDFVKPNIF